MMKHPYYLIGKRQQTMLNGVMELLFVLMNHDQPCMGFGTHYWHCAQNFRNRWVTFVSEHHESSTSLANQYHLRLLSALLSTNVQAFWSINNHTTMPHFGNNAWDRRMLSVDRAAMDLEQLGWLGNRRGVEQWWFTMVNTGWEWNYL